MLLFNAQCSTDPVLRHVSAAALLAFSVQNECQLQIDNLSGIAVLLRLLDVKDDGELAAYAAAILWNMCKSPVMLLKLEVSSSALAVAGTDNSNVFVLGQTIHAMLKDKLVRKLTELLAIPLEPFGLAITSTGERGAPGVLDFEGENLNVLITTTISSQLSVVLAVENYAGRVRSLTDQYRPRSAENRKSKTVRSKSAGSTIGKSVAAYDESGVLASRTCAKCQKPIRVGSKRYLLCAKSGCGQTYHVRCSRWVNLEDENRHAEHFYCDDCRGTMPLYYWDFVAENPQQHTLFLTETMFKAIAISRIMEDEQSVVMLFDVDWNVIGVGNKRFRISASSRDPEMFIVTISHVAVGQYPATHQHPKQQQDGESTVSIPAWQVSYARHDDKALSTSTIQIAEHTTTFWPTVYLRDVRALQYTDYSLDQLQSALIYEFRGASTLYSIGGAANAEDPTTAGLWMNLHARKAVCMKLLTEQIGRLNALKAARSVDIGSNKPSPKSNRKKAGAAASKPHFVGKRLTKVATDG